MSEYPIPYHPSWDVIDPSKLSDFSTCMRKGFYMHLLGWESDAPNNHLVFGEAMHKAMEYLLQHGYDIDACAGAYDVFESSYRKEFPPETDELFGAKVPARVFPFLKEYTDRYRSDLDDFEVVYTEISGSVPISFERVIFFRLDSILKFKNGMFGSLEHKTRGGSFSSSWLNQWPMSFQLGTYHHVLYCLYPREDVRGITINGLGFLKTKFDLQRFPFRLQKPQMEVWMDTTNYWYGRVELEKLLLKKAKADDSVLSAFPCNPSGCDKFFGCPFIDFCSSWPNPLQNCDEPPMGFRQRFWDPREVETTYKVNINGTNAEVKR